jgi:hypothetical protein
VAYRAVARQSTEFRMVIENVSNQSHAPHVEQPAAVGGNNSGRLLPPVLEGKNTEVCQFRSMGVPKDTHYPAMIAGLIVKVDVSLRQKIRTYKYTAELSFCQP